MNRAVRVTATLLSVSAAIAGLEHGIFELLQGQARPEGLFIASIGSPCVPEQAWNSCEPALTILPTFWLSGLATIAVSVLILVWAIWLLPRKHGGLGLFLLSVPLLLFGGGLFPPFINGISALLATRINKPVTRPQIGWLAAMYPWPLVAYLVIVFGQFVVGHFFNDFLQQVMVVTVGLILGSLFMAVYTAVAKDAQKTSRLTPTASAS